MSAGGEGLAYASLLEISGLIRTREISPVEITQLILERIDRLNPEIAAFYTVFHERATDAARRAEAEIAKGNYRGPLHGIPVGIKDVIDFDLTTCGSKNMAANIADTPARSVVQLEDAGAIIIGKTATFEFACGRPAADAFFPPARNPWDSDLDPGGSSSGSAVAVAAGLAYGALGTDSGGSIRWPSFACGVVGMKPTYDRVSRSGVFPFSWSLDTVGTHGRTAIDTALILEACSTPSGESSSPGSTARTDFTSDIDGGIDSLRVGIPRAFFEASCDTEILSAFDVAVQRVSSLGAETFNVELPSAHLARATFWVQASADFASIHLERYRQDTSSYGTSVRRLVESGLLVSGRDYVDAVRARAVLCSQTLSLFDDIDVLMLPTVGGMPGRIDDESQSAHFFSMEWPHYTFLFSLAGCPVINVPCGFSSAGMPIGFQLAGRPWTEAVLFRTARAYEETTPWKDRHPMLN